MTRSQYTWALQAALAVGVLAPRVAEAQPAGDEPPPEAAEPAEATEDVEDGEDGEPTDSAGSADAAGAISADDVAALRARVEALESEMEDLRAGVEAVEEDQRFHEEQVQQQNKRRLQLNGYIDFGAGWVEGNGSGIRSDVGYRVFPELGNEMPPIPASWVFMGDPLSTAINARGEPADTGESRAVTFDSVDSGGAFTFLLNTLNFNVIGSLSDEVTLNASVDFVPRRRDVSIPRDGALGDFIDVRLAYLEWRAPITEFELTLTAGKFDSVLGNEYRTQDAPDRLEVTPSLLCRYTCGRPLGLKARARFLDDRALVLNLAATNGGHFLEYFPFNSDVDVNHMITGAGRLSYMLPIGAGVDIGVSGAVGAQDMQTDDGLVQWHVGADILIDWDDLFFSAEFVQGEAPGATEPGDVQCGLAPCLRYRGVYGRIGYRFVQWFQPYVRIDWRDAVHRDALSYIYISELIRFTGGIRFDLGPHVVMKLEYTFNVELGEIPQFPNNILAASIVGRL